MLLEPKNGEAQGMLKTITARLDDLLFKKYRDEANEFLKVKKFQQAMESYEKCLKVTRKATTLDNIAIYVNKIACLLSMDRLSQVVQECNEAIRLCKLP
jgi:tetratricopeptide (TPR) repeat protein